MKTMKLSDFHLVDISPWPLMMSLATANSILSIYIKMNFLSCLLLFSMTMIYVFFLWSRDITRESTFQGMHPNKVQLSLKYGMILFITSEVMFFLSFFWTFFHSALNPTNEIGNSWPSWGVEPINPFGIPLLNTLVLVSSGVSVTYAHHSMLNQNYNYSIIWVIITVLLGGYFTVLQFMEYVSSSFSIMDSVYGSIFFISTGFHGIHVLVGTLMILFSLARLYNFQFSYKHHLMFEFSCWYWHFVDLIWLFLFISIYWWGF